jgi:hypothetical protein
VWTLNGWVNIFIPNTTNNDISSTTSNGTWQKAIPYIYINSKWHQATPYIYDNSTWKLCGE